MNNFQTDSINLSSFLLVKGVRLVDVSEDRPRHCTFIFENEAECINLYSEYMNGAQVSARDLFVKKKDLARMVADILAQKSADNTYEKPNFYR